MDSIYDAGFQTEDFKSLFLDTWSYLRDAVDCYGVPHKVVPLVAFLGKFNGNNQYPAQSPPWEVDVCGKFVDALLYGLENPLRPCPSRDFYGGGLVIKVITGMRRCGKSYLLFKLFKGHLLSEKIDEDHIIEIAFDAFENKQYRDPNKLYPYLKRQISDQGMYYVLLDEVQLLDDFEAILNSLTRMNNVDVYVTGSNARFLSKDVITEFRGRGDEVHMYPLSFAEFMTVYQGTKQDGWNEYMLYGGLPLVLSFQTPDQKITFLKALFEETYISDIVGRHNVRNKEELEDLLNILSSAIGSLTNPEKLSATFKTVKKKKISSNTIKKYIEYLCDSFLIESAVRYDVKGKKYIDTPIKYYFTDMGLRNARLNFRQLEETHTMENIIFNELKIRGFNVDVGVITQYGRNEKGNSIRKQLEIDFVCNQGSKRYYIQSAYAVSDPAKMEQE